MPEAKALARQTSQSEVDLLARLFADRNRSAVPVEQKVFLNLERIRRIQWTAQGVAAAGNQELEYQGNQGRWVEDSTDGPGTTLGV